MPHFTQRAVGRRRDKTPFRHLSLEVSWKGMWTVEVCACGFKTTQQQARLSYHGLGSVTIVFFGAATGTIDQPIHLMSHPNLGP